MFLKAKFLPQNAILDITLGASNIADIFLTFLTDKKVHKIAPVKIKAAFVSYW